MTTQTAQPETFERDEALTKTQIGKAAIAHTSGEVLWTTLCVEALKVADSDPRLAKAMTSNILAHPSFAHGLACRFSETLANRDVDANVLASLSLDVFQSSPQILASAALDLQAVYDRDPSTSELLIPFLYFKGFLALQGHRIANWLWRNNKKHMARHIQSRTCAVLSIDIHPAAHMGNGIMLDHGNGLVIGETAVVDDDVSILQDVTLGGTGKETGDRHPKIRRGALIGAGAKILGNIEIGVGAKVGAGSVVVSAVSAHTSVAGVPARVVGRPKSDLPGVTMEQPNADPDYAI
ncbi:serine O-acetyltransferase [Agrobacterium rhizogenes]|uniref:serine O-acetyltransferase n=1 Tax=Rhizobium rhizogenes TaxID=359 RepID=UPI0009F6B3FA|nr:serine O-acetyltransferase [Rhizobium rhizogenes]NTI46361.1 serine O-acetyltransferase [Rhizobium rhizogenes]NTI53044.1 serine O-acetyltransferase [Rhizobium rhizogenes]NTI98417.1 serine O-acetyltransferase [Rhizobium rhizogenes]NTJ60845.1 serine O-acetyltransferase [Rhizobium rhizogenes]